MEALPLLRIEEIQRFAPPKFRILAKVLRVERKKGEKPLLFMKDATGFVNARIAERIPVPRAGDWIEGEIFPLPSGFLIDQWKLVQKGEIPSGTKNWEKMARGDWSPEGYWLLVKLLSLLREFFRQKGYKEIITPALIPYPSFDPNVASIPVWLRRGKRKRKMYLATSPEYLMKMFLVSGEPRIFQISQVFRDGEWTPYHQPEFWMCEWYTQGQDYLGLMEDVEDLFIFLFENLTGSRKVKIGERIIDIEKPFERITVREAFLRETGKDIAGIKTSEEWARGFPEKKYPGWENSSWEEWFFCILGEQVEPKLGWKRPTFLIDFPARLGTMAKAKKEDPGTYERCEIFVAGIELGNGYTELTDWVEQRERFQKQKGKRRMPVEFLKALRTGIPPCSGFSLGLERLVQVILYPTPIASLLPFPLSDFLR
ncbi:MAG: amino acid--tRNA ligase-related protein [bacterium JZ-2024 1]